MADTQAKAVLRGQQHIVKPGEIWAIIPARGGSKGLPRKNILPLADKPLIAYSIEAGLQCNLINRCIVTTEDEEIAFISRKWGAEVLLRPAELATDAAMTSSVVRHVLEMVEPGQLPEYFILLQPTSPLRNAHHTYECLEGFLKSGCGCAVSVTEAEHHPYKAFTLQNNTLKPLFSAETLDMPRQKLPPVYRQNGAIYIMNTLLFLNVNRFYAEPAYPYVMDHQESVDVDTALDLLIANAILRQTASQKK